MPEAERITQALGGQWQRGRGIAPCPICQQERRSDQRALSITQGRSRTLFHCHKTGCDVFGELRRRGILDECPARPDRRSEPPTPPVEDRTRLQRLWRSAKPITGTLAERYLRRRGIDLEGRTPDTLRFHPALYYDPNTQLPGLLAAVTDVEGELQGIHRTFLAADGSGKADVLPNRRMLGRMTGGVVRLGPPGPVIALAEGVETALSVWTRSGIPCWSALSAAGIRGFDLDLVPPNAALLITADHDETGWLAALNLFTRARQTSRAVAVAMPKRVGEDFNDLVRPQTEPRHLLPA